MESAMPKAGDVPERHPLNTRFAWRDREGPFRRIDAAQAAAWNANGYFLLRDAVSSSQVRALIAALDPLEEQTEAFLDARGGRVGISRAGELTFTVHAVLRSKVARAFTASALFQDLCLDLLGPDCRLYWDQAVYKKPGTRDDFPWHQDNGYNFVTPQDYLTCWVPLTPATLHNGCPWVVPGVHRLGTLAHWSTPLGYQCLSEPAGAVPIEAAPGDVVVFSSLTPHRTGPNRTGEVRKAYIVQYAHDHAAMVSRENGEPMPQRHPDRQFPIVMSGGPAAG